VSFESHERPDLVDVASLIVADLLGLLDFQCFDLTGEQFHTLELMQQPPFEALGHWLAVPLPERVELVGQDVLPRDLDTDGGEQTTDAITVVRPFAAQLIELAVHMPLVFVSGIWDADRAPHIRLAFAVASQQSDQADGVQTVGLGTPGATIHLDTRRVDDHIVDAVSI
jgi:hypothetical protein